MHRDDRRVVLACAGIPAPEAVQRAAASFAEDTGFRLELEPAAAPPPEPAARYDETGRMEQNAAFAEVKRAFEQHEHRPNKASKKADAEGPYIELSFVSPEVGERHAELIEELSFRTSWRIRIAPKVDQQAVLRVAREVIPAHWPQKKGPGLDLAGRKVLLRLEGTPPNDEWEEADRELRRRTGFSL